MDGAREIYRQVITDFDGQTFAEEATVRLANSYFADLENPDSADEGVRLLQDYLATHSGGRLEVVMWQQLGLAFERLKHDPAQSLAAYEKARELGFSLPVKKDKEMWKMSQLAEEAGELQAAAVLYHRILTETPRAAEGTLARRRLTELVAQHPEWGLEVPDEVVFQIGHRQSQEEEPAPAPQAEPAAKPVTEPDSEPAAS